MFYKMNNNVGKVINSIDNLFFKSNMFMDELMRKNVNDLTDKYICMLCGIFDSEILKECLTKNKDIVQLMNNNSLFSPAFIAENMDNPCISEIMNNKFSETREILTVFKNKYETIFNQFKLNIANMHDDYDNFKDLTLKTISLSTEYGNILLKQHIYPINALLTGQIEKFININLFYHSDGKISYII